MAPGRAVASCGGGGRPAPPEVGPVSPFAAMRMGPRFPRMFFLVPPFSPSFFFPPSLLSLPNPSPCYPLFLYPWEGSATCSPPHSHKGREIDMPYGNSPKRPDPRKAGCTDHRPRPETRKHTGAETTACRYISFHEPPLSVALFEPSFIVSVCRLDVPPTPCATGKTKLQRQS